MNIYINKSLLISLVSAMALVTCSALAKGHYAAMGDSFSSGTGTLNDYGENNNCLRTNLAYPVLLSEKINAELTNLTCSGATIKDLEEKQISELKNNPNIKNVKLVTLTIGGDDLNFTPVVTTCVVAELFDNPSKLCTDKLNSMIETASDEKFKNRLSTAYEKILKIVDPSTKVYVLNYPRLFTLPRAQGYAISDESRLLANKVVDTLSDTIEGAVNQLHNENLIFVDVRDKFEGNGVTGDTGKDKDWIYFLNSSNLKNTLHPKAEGQEKGYLVAIREALKKNGA